jgi:hypothetical protein
MNKRHKVNYRPWNASLSINEVLLIKKVLKERVSDSITDIANDLNIKPAILRSINNKRRYASIN